MIPLSVVSLKANELSMLMLTMEDGLVETLTTLLDKFEPSFWKVHACNMVQKIQRVCPGVQILLEIVQYCSFR